MWNKKFRYKAIFLGIACLAFLFCSIDAWADTTSIQTGDYTITADGSYQLANGYSGVITIASEVNTVTLIGAEDGNINEDTRIVAADGRTTGLSLTIQDLKIRMNQGSGWVAASGIKFSSDAGLDNYLYISGNCSVTAAGNGAGIEVAEHVILTIDKVTSNTEDVLTTSIIAGNGTNGECGAGIGSWAHMPGGHITIKGGTINAASNNGAGIGGGGLNGAVEIQGGIINASSQTGAGIGGGSHSNGGTVLILGGKVTAISYGADRTPGGAGIGGGGGNYATGHGGMVTITGGTVHASGRSYAAGIGGGPNGNGGVVTISGGTVIAEGSYAAGIGGGYGGAGAVVTITGHPTIIATGDITNGAEHIGHGTASINSGTLTDGTAALTYLRFRVTDGTNPLADAEVTVDSHAYATDQNGLTGCVVLQSDGTKNYSVAKAGFQTQNDVTADFLSTPLMNLEVAVSMNLAPEYDGFWTDYKASAFAGGDGSKDDPYQIATAEQLALLSQNTFDNDEYSAGKYFILTDDIDLHGHYWKSMNVFKGVIDGQNHSIKNMKIESSESIQGFISTADAGAVIENIKIVDCDITMNANYAAALIGYYDSATVKNCSSTGQITGSRGVGGLVGGGYGITMTDSESSCTVVGTYPADAWIGGLIGSVWGGENFVTRCSYSGTVTGYENVGGICGWARSMTIMDCYSVGTIVSSNSDGDWYNIGGILGCGNTAVTILNCYSAGTIDYTVPDSAGKLGGIIGGLDSGCQAIDSFYNSATPAGQAGTPMSLEDMKASAFVATLNAGRNPEPWAADTGNVNGGFPILDLHAAVTAPTLLSAETNGIGDAVILTFDKAMADPSGKQNQFSVNAGTILAAALKAGDNTKIELTLASAVSYGQDVKVTYAAGDVTAEDGGALASFADQQVTNQVAPTECGTIQFDAGSNSVYEGYNGWITVERVGGTQGPVSVNYATIDGTALAGANYTAQSGTLTWSNGDGSSRTIPCTIANDSTYNGYLDFKYTLSDPTGGAVLGTQSTLPVQIRDNDNPPTPTGFTATAGDGQVKLTWNPVNDARYVIYYSTQSGIFTDAGSHEIYDENVTEWTATGLTNGTTYYFAMKSGHDIYYSALTAEISARPAAPATPGGVDGGGGGGTPRNNGSSLIYIDGELVPGGALEQITDAQGRLVTIITIDSLQIESALRGEDDQYVLSVPVYTGTDAVICRLNGLMVKMMADKGAALEIKTERAMYLLPAVQIDIDAILSQFGDQVDPEKVQIDVEIGSASSDLIKLFNQAAADRKLTVAVPPVEFKITCSYNGREIEVQRFHAYVQRWLAIPDGTDHTKITTAVVIDNAGKFRHVPTRVVLVGGKYYALVTSKSNSAYAVVSNPAEFADMTKHWAKDAVNDMSSRLIVSGIDESSFAPNKEITRAEFAAIIVRALGLKPAVSDKTFTDVRNSGWYYESVMSAYEYGIISGYKDGTFKPNERITREEAMSMIAKAMSLTGKFDSALNEAEMDALFDNYTDSLQIDSWARSAAAECIGAGLFEGEKGSLRPDKNITRAETAVIVQRLLVKAGLI